MHPHCSAKEFMDGFRTKYRLNHMWLMNVTQINLDFLSEVIKRGYPVNEHDYSGFTLIHTLSTSSFSLDQLKIALDNGGDVNKGVQRLDLNQYDNTALHDLILIFDLNWNDVKSKKKRIDLLIRHGADMKAKNGINMSALAYLRHFIRKEEAKKRCYCGTDATCFRHVKIERLKKIDVFIQNCVKKNTTLFELMLPQIKKYKPPSNKRRRKQ